MKISGRIYHHGKDWSVDGVVFRCNRKFNEWIIRELEKYSRTKQHIEVWLRDDSILLGLRKV